MGLAKFFVPGNSIHNHAECDSTRHASYVFQKLGCLTKINIVLSFSMQSIQCPSLLVHSEQTRLVCLHSDQC